MENTTDFTTFKVINILINATSIVILLILFVNVHTGDCRTTCLSNLKLNLRMVTLLRVKQSYPCMIDKFQLSILNVSLSQPNNAIAALNKHAKYNNTIPDGGVAPRHLLIGMHICLRKVYIYYKRLTLKMIQT